MAKTLMLAWVCTILAVMGSGAFCDTVFPTVGFSFDENSCEYSWTVNYAADVNVYFSTFLVNASLPAGSWNNATGAWSGTVPQQNEGWTFTAPPNGDGTDALRWYGQSHQRTPTGGTWTGVFKIVVPNSRPIAGTVRTYASIDSSLLQSSFVPSLVPEPSSVLMLCSMAGLVPLIYRKRRQ
jgi:hypothetical protein